MSEAKQFPDNPFKKAVADSLWIKMLLMGESGTGKTWTALEVASRLAKSVNSRVAFVDSEGADGKAQLYGDPYFDFDHMALAGYSPEHYYYAMLAAVQSGYKVLVVDSFTHAWSGSGGVLDIVDKAKTGWAAGKPRHHMLIEKILKAPIHLIGTVRVKNSYGKTASGQIDWASVHVDARQDSEFEYEFDLSAILDRNHTMTIRKSRCPELKSGHVVTNNIEMDTFSSQVLAWANRSDGKLVSCLSSPDSELEDEILEAGCSDNLQSSETGQAVNQHSDANKLPQSTLSIEEYIDKGSDVASSSGSRFRPTPSASHATTSSNGSRRLS